METTELLTPVTVCLYEEVPEGSLAGAAPTEAASKGTREQSTRYSQIATPSAGLR